jgi:hypothetical protein
MDALRVHQPLNFKEISVNRVVKFHRLVEGNLHYVIIRYPDHDAFLVIKQGVNGGNSHSGGINPVFGCGTSSPLNMTKN